jgi:hypothetical protein
MIKSCKRYIVISYDELGIDSDLKKHVFPHLTAREVVGIMKTVMNNFNPAHVDVMREADD